jgi:uncharacterized protein YqgC (DUF456 family)
MMMDVLGWILVILLFAIGMAGAVFPILPGVLAVYAAFFVYGWFFGFDPFGAWFWSLQTFIVVSVFIADYAVSALGVQRFGGSKASVWGSTIGLIIGPFVIPVVGLLVGPFIGAAGVELVRGTRWQDSLKIGAGSVVGLLASTVVKIVLQVVMIIAFILWIL